MMESALRKSYYHYLYNILNHKTKYEVCNLPGIRCQALQVIHVGFFFIGFTNNEVGVSVNKQITGFMLKSFKTEGFYIWSIGIVHYVQIIIPTKRSILKGLEGCRLFLIKVQCRISILHSTFYSQETHLQASSAESSQQYRQIFYSSNIFQRTQKDKPTWLLENLPEDSTDYCNRPTTVLALMCVTSECGISHNNLKCPSWWQKSKSCSCTERYCLKLH